MNLEGKLKSLEKSCKRLKGIVENCKNPKFEHLDSWEFFQSKSFTKENNGSKPKFKKYKRGTIVFVNFGTSIGTELSGNHFAIVLNKSDNPLNGSLTVVPLTSKNKGYNLSLGNELIKQILVDIFNETLNIARLIHSIKIEFDEENPVDKHNDENLRFIVEYITKYEHNLKKDEDGTYIIDNETTLRIVEQNLKEMEKVRLYYEKYNKDSYAMIDSITTISKYRIRKPINKMDPIGRIQISNSLLDSIDSEVLSRFTHNKQI